MSLKQFPSSVLESIRGALIVLKDTVRVLKNHPEIATYPYIAAVFISITFPLVSSTLFASWYRRVFSETGAYIPNKAHTVLGLVGFWAFYSALVAAYFTCAVSISVIAKLEGRDVKPFYGLARVGKNFVRVTRFAIISVFFFPLSVYAQRRKLPGGWLGVLGSSLTMHMAQAAPAILTTNKKMGETVRVSIDTLGKSWRESLVLKISMYLLVFLIFVAPKLIQHGFFRSQTASNVGWVVSIVLGASSLVGFKVANAIFTAVLYHQARNKK